jgi:hypothetical protein
MENCRDHFYECVPQEFYAKIYDMNYGWIKKNGN